MGTLATGHPEPAKNPSNIEALRTILLPGYVYRGDDGELAEAEVKRVRSVQKVYRERNRKHADVEA